MKISYNWLKEILPINLPAEEVSVMLTDCGLEVESFEEIETIKGGLKGIVVGKVLSVAKHPDADKLSITTVDVGSDAILNIVCGAPNVAAHQKVLVATVGAKLYPTSGEPFEIKKSKIRGAVSEGMICAEDEIGVGTSHEGILVLPDDVAIGTPASSYFKIDNDTVFEIGLTPNRIDAASHIGVARDLAAVINAKKLNNDCKLNIPNIDLTALPSNDFTPVNVEVEDSNACVRYTGIVVNNVTVSDSPDWLKNKLLAIGLRPINNIVDITNYVMHECAQPLHAFDVSNIAGNKIKIRFATEGEKIITLDDAERILKASDLVIANAKNAMCIAGVFGGKNSGVSNTTTSVFIESACFNPVLVRKTSKHLNLKTDSSFRFERGTDANNTMYAMKRAAQLICDIAGGGIASEVVDIYPTKVERKIVAFSFDNCDRLIGKEIEHSIVRNILTSLDIEILEKGTDALKIAIPTAKVDVTREVDVIEEVLRIYGYNNVELPQKLNTSITYIQKPDKEKWQEKISELLTSKGFTEMMSLSLTKNEYSLFSDLYNENESVKILNPLSSELNVLRQTLLYSGLESIHHNQNRKRSDLKLYEFGKVYSFDDSKEGLKKYNEKFMLSLFVTGSKNSDSWASASSDVNFFTLKAITEAILVKAGVKYQTVENTNTKLGVGLSYLVNNKSIINLINVHKSTLKKFDIKQEVFYAEIDWVGLVNAGSKVKTEFKELPKYPEVKRDLALLLDKKVAYSDLEKAAFKTEKKLLKQVNLFDVYEGKNLEEGKKSYALSFTLSDETATLNDKQIEQTMLRLQQTFEKDFGAILR